jgi:spore germination protein YaaH
VRNSGFEYATLASLADGVIVMAYDEHWATGEPGPVASQSWFMNIVGQRMHEIPPEKLIIAIGNYGYDWAPGMPAKELTFEDAVLTAKESEGDIGMEDA